MQIRDGNEEIKDEIPRIIKIVARTAQWVHPETFHRLPVWYPFAARGRVVYDKTWATQYQNTKRSTGETTGKTEANIIAGKALIEALGVTGRKPKNWTVCHIWGYDDPSFAKEGSIVRDPRYYSCVGNMIWLPTPLKGFTDALPEIKTMLRTCAYYMYGWVCEHDGVYEQAAAIKTGVIPEGYPSDWPAANRNNSLPPGTASFTAEIERRITRRKEAIKAMLANENLAQFPREDVRHVLAFWKIEL